MKVRIYKKKINRKKIYIMTGTNSMYSQSHGEKFPYRTTYLPKHLIREIIKMTPKEQQRLYKTLYKGLR